jgi:4-amino-4-deoxy-L-arabinose transferase-like glycosyltransferase
VHAAQISHWEIIAYRASAVIRRLSRLAWHRLLFWALAAGGAALRLSLIAGQRFHSDEAIYGYWAQLIASGQDPLLLSAPLDKPPLFIYLLAGVFKLFGPTEVAARLISQAASLAAVGLTYALGRRLYGQPEALLAAAVMALSPFNILFAPTAFIDPLMVALVLAAATLAAARRWVWAGVAAGLAVATKQHALLFLPLVVATGWIAAQGRSRARGLVRMGLGCLVVMQGLTVWDALRWRVRASFWEQSAVSHGPLHLVNWWQLGERLADWSKLLSYVLASPLLNAVLLLGVPLLLWRSRRAVLANCGDDASAARADWLLAGFSALFFLAHWLLSFNVWDRYLLGLAPLVALLLARIVWQGAARLDIKRIGLVGLAVAILLAGPAAKAGRVGYPIGGDHGAYQGLEQVIAFFRQTPAGSVVWHRYLGWHYFHYLFGVPLDFEYYAEPAILAAQAPPETERQQYVVFPAWKEKAEKETRAALAAVGLGLRTERRVWRQDGSLAFTIYRIVAAHTPSGGTWTLAQ